MSSKKRIAIITIVLLCALVFAVAFCCVIEANPPARKALFENGVYSPEAFAYNMQLSKKGGITLFNGNSTKYTVIYPSGASDSVIKSANVLADGIDAISGVRPLVAADDKTVGDYEICVGKTSRSISLKQAVSDSGFAIKNDHERLFIYAETDLGTRNAVYGFLEDQMGCLFTKDVSYFPTLKKAVLDPMEKYYEPRFSYAESTPVYSTLKADAFNDICGLISGDVVAYADELLGIDGLSCLSDDEVRTALTLNTVNRMANDATHTVDVSLKPGTECGCDACEAFAEQYDSRNGSVVYVVNDLAEKFSAVNFSTTIRNGDACVGLDTADNFYLRIEVLTDEDLEKVRAWKGSASNVVIADKRFLDVKEPTLDIALSVGMLSSFTACDSGICGVTEFSSHPMVNYIENKILWNTEFTAAQLFAKYTALTSAK